MKVDELMEASEKGKVIITSTARSQGTRGKAHKQKHTYNAPIRKCIYTCILNQVPVDKAGAVIDFIIRELARQTLSDVPCPSTAASMAVELGILSDLQVGEVLFKGNDVTLS